MESNVERSTIIESLRNIKEQTARLDQVAFVFQPWIEFNNLCSDGYRISAVQFPVIPRLTLIPLVSITSRHIDSRLNSSTNKYVPLPIPYQRSIKNSFIDLQRKYTEFGLVMLKPLSCSLDEADRVCDLFDKAMEPYHEAGVLEDLPMYFGTKSPVDDVFEKSIVRLKWTFERKIDSMVTHLEMTEEEAARFKACIPTLAESAIKCHRKALHPSQGVLTTSIKEINSKRKAQFDEVDVFLRKQFPGYNSDSMLSRANANTDMAALTEVLKDLVTAAVAGKKEEPKKVKPKMADMIADQSDVGDPPEAFSESLEQELAEDDTERCAGVTKAGTRCKLKPDPTAQFPEYCPAHQDQAVVEEPKEEAAIAAV